MEAKKDENFFFKNVKKELQNIIETENKGEEEEEEKETDDEEILKKNISSHPLYGLLLQTHLDCLKVSSGEDTRVETADSTIATANLINKENVLADSTAQTSADLDHFMEAYCLALRSLKEAMEKPVDETHRFVDAMYTQLRDIVHPTQ